MWRFCIAPHPFSQVSWSVIPLWLEWYCPPRRVRQILLRHFQGSPHAFSLPRTHSWTFPQRPMSERPHCNTNYASGRKIHLFFRNVLTVPRMLVQFQPKLKQLWVSLCHLPWRVGFPLNFWNNENIGSHWKILFQGDTYLKDHFGLYGEQKSSQGVPLEGCFGSQREICSLKRHQNCPLK